MKEGWQLKKLGEVCKIERGSSPRPIKKYFTDKEDGVNWIKIGDTKGVTKYLYSTKEKITKEGAIQSRFVKEGDIILSNSMSFGNPYIMKTQGYIHDGWFVLRLPSYVDTEYFYYLLTSPNVQEQIKQLANGAIVKNISSDLVKKVEVAYPKSISEQLQIVTLLDECFAYIDQAKANLTKNMNNSKELFQSELNQIFSQKGEVWIEKKLGEVYDVRDGTHDSPKYLPKGYVLITSKNLKNDLLTFENVNYISEQDYININKRSRVDKGDVLFAMIGTIGNPVVIIDEPNFAIKNVALFKVSNNQNSYFLKYYLDSKLVIDKMLSEAKGTTQKFVGLGYLRNFKIMVPPKTVQQNIVTRLDTLSAQTKKLETLYKDKLNELEDLKKSILQKAFSGELVRTHEKAFV